MDFNKNYKIDVTIDRSILNYDKAEININDDDLKLIDDLFNYLLSNTFKYSETDLRFISIAIFILSQKTGKEVYKILEDLKII